jgi:hypothetical protein
VPQLPIDPQHLAEARVLCERFDQLLERLTCGEVYRCGEAPAPPTAAGVYAFSEGDVVFHVGRTTNLQRRRREQTGLNNDRNTATYAFRIAAAEAYAAHQDLPKKREDLERHPEFTPYFRAWKERVRNMDFRCVEIEEAPQRYGFEMLASIALGLPPELWEEH